MPWCHAEEESDPPTRRRTPADTEALARAEGQSINETVKAALREAVERRRHDSEFKTRLQRIIEQDRKLLERLAQ